MNSVSYVAPKPPKRAKKRKATILGIMCLHYLVKLEMFHSGVLPLNCNKKKLHNLRHLNCGLQICQIYINQVDRNV